MTALKTLAAMLRAGAMVAMLAVALALSSAAAPAAAQTDEAASKQPAAPVASLAQTQAKAAIGKAERAVAAIKKDLGEIDKDLARPDIANDQLEALRTRLEALRVKALEEQASLSEPLANVRRQVEQLGKPPKDGGSEDPAIAADRKVLGEQLAGLEAVAKQLDILAVQTGQLSARAAGLQRENFVRRIFEPRRSVFNPLLWADGASGAAEFFSRTLALAHSWVATTVGQGAPAGLYVPLAAFALVIVGLVLIGTGRIFREHASTPASVFHQMWRALRRALLSALFVAAGYGAYVLAANSLFALPPRIDGPIRAIFEAFLFAAFSIALARGIFRPGAPAMRLAAVGESAARSLYLTALAAIVVHAVDIGVSAVAAATFLPLGFNVAWEALVALVLALLIIRFLQVSARTLRAGATGEGGEEGPARKTFGWARGGFYVAWAAVLAALVALAFGYIAFAGFIVARIITITVIIAAIYLIHHLIDVGARSALDEASIPGRFARHTLNLSQRAINRFGLLVSTLIDVAAVVVGVPAVLMQLSLSWLDFKTWITAAFFGMRVGDVVISPSSILLGIAVLVVGLAVARTLTGWLDRRVLERANLDPGVRNSVRTGARYALGLLAIGFALTSAGVNFSNLAIIAGALSVGIGFGLQSIVNNFVSGLILLAERPIKVGDWVVTSGGEGTVREIKVRSTEIETFDRCTIIVPNSSLISEPVSNWYHRSRMGRVRISVGVSYDADPEQVRAILVECANAHERCLVTPAAFALFMDFGDNALIFELRVYIDDVAWVSVVASDLRFAIFKALSEAGIEIPFPQRDIHIRSGAVGK